MLRVEVGAAVGRKEDWLSALKSRMKMDWIGLDWGVVNDESAPFLTTHMYRLYDRYAVLSPISPHCREFELRVNAAGG